MLFTFDKQCIIGYTVSRFERQTLDIVKEITKMTYGKAMATARSQSKNTNENLMVYFDSEKGNVGYFIIQEDDFWQSYYNSQQEIALWFNGEIMEEW